MSTSATTTKDTNLAKTDKDGFIGGLHISHEVLIPPKAAYRARTERIQKSHKQILWLSESNYLELIHQYHGVQ